MKNAFIQLLKDNDRSSPLNFEANTFINVSAHRSVDPSVRPFGQIFTVAERSDPDSETPDLASERPDPASKWPELA